MEKQFIPYEEALVLKQLGFDESCLAGYQFVQYGDPILVLPFLRSSPCNTDIDKANTFTNNWIEIRKATYYCTAPLWQQAFDWFRKKYGLYYTINPLGHNMNLALVGPLGSLKSCNVPEYGTYEEAQLTCLKKLIEIVKNK